VEGEEHEDAARAPRSVAAVADQLAGAAQQAGRAAQAGDWGEVLAGLGRAERLADEALHAAAWAARAAGWSWNRIGPAVGVTQQTAWRRFTNPRRRAVTPAGPADAAAVTAAGPRVASGSQPVPARGLGPPQRGEQAGQGPVAGRHNRADSSQESR